MSRIHEALKKAELERPSAPPAAVVAPLTDLASRPTAKGVNGTGTGSTKIQTEPTPEPYLRFEDLKTRCAHPRWNFHPNASVFSDAASGHGAEQFRTLRARLYQMRGNNPLRTLLVTSALPDEGKTFVASNLAQAFVRREDHSALIIDADLRRAHLHIPLGAPPTPGLTDYLLGQADELAVIQHGRSGNLYFVPAGTVVTNPSELLMNGRLKTLLDRVATAFTWVIIDSPPCLMVSDASVLADLCDGVLLVVRAASTPAAVAQRARQEMQGKRILGAVLNSAEPGQSYGSSYYGYSDK